MTCQENLPKNNTPIRKPVLDIAGLPVSSTTMADQDGKPVTRKLVIGLLGGIGSGKSLVASLFHKQGAKVMDADKLGHQALQDPDIREKILSRWGRDLLDTQGTIDRKKLAAIVFSQPAERKILESFVHPFIAGRIREEVVKGFHDPGCRFLVLDAAVMLEAGWNKACDRLVFIDTPKNQRLDWITKTRGWTEQQLEDREKAQLPLEQKAVLADHIIQNNGSQEKLQQQVEELVKSWHLEDQESKDLFSVKMPSGMD